MGLVLIAVIAYLPIFYRIHRRLHILEQEVERLSQEKNNY